jgi:beta-N-acetylhexosaminidase
MKKRLVLSATLAAALVMGGCGTTGTQDTATTSTEESTEAAEETTLQASDLTLEQKVGQLFIVRPDALDTSYTLEQVNDSKAEGATQITDSIRENIEKYQVGGICQFGKNIVDPDQITQFNSDLKEASDIPMFITVDEEGGRVARLANTETFDLPKYESAAAVGEQGTDAAYDMGYTIGTYISEYGFNVDFAPDADVNTNPDNPIIGTRAFSSDATKAAELAKACGQGLADAGVIPTFKHFPGHGDTAEDSHTGFAYSYRTLEEIQDCELLTFKAATEVTPHAVMVSHISMPNVTGDNTPATLSSTIIDLIPDKDNTLIITDAMSMQAITDAYSSGEAAVMTLQAGCDIVLMPYDFTEAYDAVLAACKDGTISEERLDQSVNKILKYKASMQQ